MSLLKKLFGGSGKVTFRQTQQQPDGNTYDVYSAQTRSDGLSFLRQHEVKEERRYAIVETPQGNIGKDFIMIFDERTQDMIELAVRQPLKTSTKSASHCCRCGYAIIPLRRTQSYGDGVGAIHEFVIVSEMKKQGTGFACPQCRALCCAICATPSDAPTCPLCRAKVSPYDA
jgi:hypothetical protein